MNRKETPRMTLPEWLTLCVSLVVVGAMVWIGIREEMNRQQGPAGHIRIALQPENSEIRNGTFFIPYEIRNTGSVAVTSAEIWIEAYAGPELVQSAEIRISALPLQGTQSGIFVTTLDPNQYEFRGRLETVQFP